MLTFFGVIVLVLMTAAFYAPVITFDFIAEYDDQFYLIDNPVLEKPSIDGFISIFTSFRQTDYLPVLYASFFWMPCHGVRTRQGFTSQT